jgi:uncharacterized protein (DUF1697 family)
VRLYLKIERALGAAFGGAFPVVVVPQEQLDRLVKNAPPAFGADAARYRHYKAFVKPPLLAREILPTISLKDGVDEAS